MKEPYDVAVQLTLLAAWIDGLLADETASRHAIAEEASARLKDITRAYLTAGEQATPEEAVKAALSGMAEVHQDTLRQAFADGIAYRMALFAESATCAECVGYPQPCGEHQGHRDAASLYRTLAAEFGSDPDAEPGDDL